MSHYATEGQAVFFTRERTEAVHIFLLLVLLRGPDYETGAWNPILPLPTILCETLGPLSGLPRPLFLTSKNEDHDNRHACLLESCEAKICICDSFNFMMGFSGWNPIIN